MCERNPLGRLKRRRRIDRKEGRSRPSQRSAERGGIDSTIGWSFAKGNGRTGEILPKGRGVWGKRKYRVKVLRGVFY